MKKILISILIVLLVVLAYFTIFKGLKLENLDILSVSQIAEENDKLTKDIESTQTLLKKNYPDKKDELSSAVTELLEKKEEYFNLAKVSTEGEISKANTEETYLIEYLWTKVGRYASKRGVNLKFDVNTGDSGEENIKNLSFTVTGKYIAIVQFVGDLEDDDKLSFVIENYKMTKDSEDTSNLVATFNVKNVRVKYQ